MIKIAKFKFRHQLPVGLISPDSMLAKVSTALFNVMVSILNPH